MSATGEVRGSGLGLRLKLLLAVSLVLLATLLTVAVSISHTHTHTLESSVKDKARALGRFLALISPEAIYGYDVTTLDRFVEQIATDPDVRFATIFDPEGHRLTTARPPELSDAGVGEVDSAGQVAHDTATLELLHFPILNDGELLGEILIGLDRGRIAAEAELAFWKQLALYLGVLLLLAGVLMVVLRRLVLRPMDSLVSAAERISGGDLEHRAEVYGNDEIGRLTTCFNDMMDELRGERLELLKLSQAVEQSPVSVLITDTAGIIEYVNPTFTRVTGYSAEELIGQNPRILKSGINDPEQYSSMWKSILAGDSWIGEFCNRRKDGSLYWESASIGPIRQPDGRITHYLGVKEDITQRKRLEDQLQLQANTDALTGLPNRNLATRRLAELIEQAQQAEPSDNWVAILYIDLDNFKRINDTLGHDMGDKLLIEVATRLRSCLGNTTELSRLSGDEFIAILTGPPEQAHEPAQTAQLLVVALEQPFDLDRRSLVVTASVGVARYPDDAGDAETLLRHADSAMYQAKRDGRDAFRVFNPAKRHAEAENTEIEARLRRAFDDDELYLVFQPIVSLETRQIAGVELLMRWLSPILGEVSPGRFIPVAEESGQIVSISAWALERVVRLAKDWPRLSERPLWLSVNVSPRWFRIRSFPDQIERAAASCTEHGVNLHLEITEGMLFEYSQRHLERMQRLHASDVRFALDDFGTGYSSLAYLKRLPIDQIKIDRCFISGLPRDPGDRALTEAIVLMGHKLGHGLIAEGVETEAQARYLTKLGVEYGQGFLFGRPMTERQFSDWLYRHIVETAHDQGR